jgi:hypothetical protein
MSDVDLRERLEYGKEILLFQEEVIPTGYWMPIPVPAQGPKILLIPAPTRGSTASPYRYIQSKCKYKGKGED